MKTLETLTPAERLALKGVGAALDMQEAGPRTKAHAVAKARLQGLAEAADVFNVAFTPAAFETAAILTAREVGNDPVAQTAGTRERAAQARSDYYGALLAAFDAQGQSMGLTFNLKRI